MSGDTSVLYQCSENVAKHGQKGKDFNNGKM